jgi:ferritin-like metal-binding protein YciE
MERGDAPAVLNVKAVSAMRPALRPKRDEIGQISKKEGQIMPINSLHDVYIDQMQDIYSANRQSAIMTGKLAEVASHEELKKALKDGVVGINAGMSELRDMISSHGEDPTGEFCKGMEGLVKEAQAHVLDAEFGDSDACDAMIITQYQRMVHYALAGYGCCVAFANRLGHDGDGKRLQKCLDETYDGDKRMTAIATGEVNKAAASASTRD